VGSLPLSRARPLIQSYDAEILSHRSLDGKGFRVELETQNVTGHRDFDVQIPEHTLTLTPDGPPTWVSGHVDGRQIEPFRVRPGQLTLRPAGERFRGHTEGVGTRGEVRLAFEPEFVTDASGADIDPSRLELVRSMELRNPSILQALAALGREVEQPGPMGRAYAESLVVLMVTELVRHHSTLPAAPGRTSGLPARRLRKVIDYIEAHLGEDLSLLTLAAEAGTAPAHFAREFKRAMRTSVHRYLLGRRVEWAAALLSGTTEQPVAEVALATGFSSQAHLTTAFQRLYATTPAAYRRERSR
jgi:AraC family transcriptional regulator